MNNEFEEFINAVKRGNVENVRNRILPEFVNRRFDEYALTPLLEASARGHLEVVKVLLDHGADPTMMDRLGWSSLYQAVFWSHADVVAHFIEIGVDLNNRDYRGHTVLDIAREQNNFDCVKILKAAAEKEKKTAQILNYARKDDLNQFKKIFPTRYIYLRDAKSGEYFVDVLVKSESFKIIELIRSQQVTAQEMTQFLLMRKNRIANSNLRLTQECLLHRAISHGIIGPFERFYDLHLINSESLFGDKSALQLAIDYGSRLMTKFILKGVLRLGDWRTLQFDNETFQGICIRDVICKRLKKLKRYYKKGYTRLQIAVLDNRSDVANFILDMESCGLNDDTNLGRVVYHSIDRANDCFRSLVQYEPKLDFVNKFEQNLLHVAIERDMEESYQYLVDNMDNLDQVDYMGLAAIHRAVLAENRDLTAALMEKMENWKFTIQPLIQNLSGIQKTLRAFPNPAKVYPNIKESKNIPTKMLSKLTNRENALTINIKACDTVFECFTKKLKSADLLFSDGDGNTVIHLAASTLDDGLCKCVLEISNYALQIQNYEGNTPLMEMIQTIRALPESEMPRNVGATIKCLVNYGSDIEAKYKNGNTVVQESLKFSSETIVLALTHSKKDLHVFTKENFNLCIEKEFYKFIDDTLPHLNQKIVSSLLDEDFFNKRLLSIPLKMLKKYYNCTNLLVKQNVLDGFLFVAYENNDYTFFDQLMPLNSARWNLMITGDTILTHLIKKRDKKFCIKLLGVDRCDELVNKCDKDNHSPIQVAISEQFYEILYNLLPYVSNINEEDNDGETALSLLMRQLNKYSKTDFAEELLQLSFRLMEKGAVIDKVNESTGKSPITYCLDKTRRSKIEVYYSSINSKSGKTPNLVEGDLTSDLSPNICLLCVDRVKDCVLECGHTLCMECEGRIDVCPFCRADSTNPRKMHL